MPSSPLNKEAAVMTRKKIYIILLSLLTAAIAATLFITIYNIRINSAADENIKAEIAALNENTAVLEEQKKTISDEINNISADLSTKETINQYYLEYKKTHDSLSEEVTNLQNQANELDEQIEQKRQSLAAPDAIEPETKGKVYALKKNETYSCPDKIPAGRYIVSGTGSFVIYASDGKARANENLDVAYNNSYTFDLDDKEKIKASGDVKLTELK